MTKTIEDIHEVLIKFVEEYSSDSVIFRSDRAYTGREMAEEMRNGTDMGKEYGTALLRVARDFLMRQAQR